MEALLASLTQKKLGAIKPNGDGDDELTLDASYKHIVIGSGMGGGMVARQLIENGEKVALFEGGGLLFSTHCLNTSRPHFNSTDPNTPGRDNEVIFQDKDWDETDEREPIRERYKVQKEKEDEKEEDEKEEDEKEEDERNVCSGGSVFALGGRSLLWSLEAPAMDLETARRHFPQDVIDYLYGLAGYRVRAGPTPNEKESGYAKAMRIMGNSSPSDLQYPYSLLRAEQLSTMESPLNLGQPSPTIPAARSAIETAIASLRRVEKLEHTDIFPTPIGAEFTGGNKLHYFPQNAYSTVDYLLHHGLDTHPDNPLNLFVDVPVFRLKKDPKAKRISKLILKPHWSGDDVVVDVGARNVILCAGTVNTAAIALRSELIQEAGISGIGKGLTDHEIWMSRYWKENDTRKADACKADTGKAADNSQPVELSCYVTIDGYDDKEKKACQRPCFLTICTHAEKFFSHKFADESGIPKSEGAAESLNIMFEFDADWNKAGEVDCDVTVWDPTVKIARPKLDGSDDFNSSLRELSKRIREELGFKGKHGSTTKDDMPVVQGFGSVAHEVGTMRMDKNESSKNRGSKTKTDQKLAVPKILGAGTENLSEKAVKADRTLPEWVVDSDLKVRNLDNLYVCDLSVFPFSPAANPSLTLTALAMRLGDHLAQ